MLASEIHMRDPWILPHEGAYYLTGSTGDFWGKQTGGFRCYSSKDLVDWTDHGFILQRQEPPTWAAYQFWAPEMVYRKGRFWLFYSGNSDTTCRGTGVAVSDSPLGPFVNVSDQPLTPSEWECLDGHLFTDDDGAEWFIYVHEWVQCEIGEMWAQRIAPDYSQLTGTPHFLFRGKSATWCNNVIDGPMMVLRDGVYNLFWSSFNARDGYCTGFATAPTVTGPYQQSPEPVIAQDGGHNCVFRGFDGKLYTSFHRPNSTPNERVWIVEIEHTDDGWKLGSPVGR